MSKGLGSQIYGGAAGFGRFYAVFSAIIATLLGIVSIAAGIWLLLKKQTYTHSTVATVNSVQCTTERTGGHNSSTTYNCSLNVTYKVDGKTYHRTLAVDSSIDYEGLKTVKIYYNPHDPSDAEVEQFPYKILGSVALGFGVLIMLGAWFWVWVTRRYKFAAAATGIGEALHIARVF